MTGMRRIQIYLEPKLVPPVMGQIVSLPDWDLTLAAGVRIPSRLSDLC